MKTPAIHRTMTPVEGLLLLILSVVWGGSFFFIAIAVKEIPPFTIVTMRVVLGAAILLLVMRFSAIPFPVGREIWTTFLVIGLVNSVIPFSLLVWGQSHIASGLASILNGTTPLFTVLVAHFMTDDEKITPSRLAGLAVGLAGVAIMMGHDLLNTLGTDLPAQLACLVAGLAYAFGGVYGRRFSALGIAPIAAAVGQFTGAAILIVPLMLIVDQPWRLAMPSTGALTAVLGLALLSTAFAYILYFRLLASAGATNVHLVTLLIPVTAVLLGIAFLGESLEPKHLAGMALIGLGLAVIDGRPALAMRRMLGR